MSNQVILEISSNADCNVYNGNLFLFSLKAHCSTKISIEKENIELKIFEIENQSKSHQIEYDFVGDYYRIIVDLISIAKAQKFIANYKPIVKNERGSRSYWEKERIDKSFQFIYGYDLDRVFATGHNPNSDFIDGYAKVRFRSYDSNEYYGFKIEYQFIDKLGNLAPDYKENYVENNSKRRDVLMPNDKNELVNSKNNELLEYKYDTIFTISDSLLCVKHIGKYGIINVNKDIILPFKFDEITLLNNDFLKVSIDKKNGLYNDNFEEVFPPKYDQITEFEDNYAKVKLNGKWGLIDKEGLELVSPKYDKIYDFVDGMARVKLHNWDFDFIDKSGRNLIAKKNDYGTKYKDAQDFSHGFAAVKNHELLWGFVDKYGNELIECQYEEAMSFSEGLACVKSAGMYGYIDTKGYKILGFDYYDANSFKCGYALVAIKSTHSHLKGELNKLIFPEDEEYDLEGPEPLVDTDKIYIDQNGIELKIKPIAEIYDLENNLKNSSDSNYYEITDATDFYEGYARIKIKGIWRLLDTQGNFY